MKTKHKNSVLVFEHGVFSSAIQKNNGHGYFIVI